MLATKKVNKVKIRTIPLEGEEDKRPIKGFELCKQLYANIYLCAKKNSGKTTLIWNILDRCTGRDTEIFAFVSTINNDASWRTIQSMCEDRGWPFHAFTSIMDEKVDQLEVLVKLWEKEAAEQVGTGAEPPPPPPRLLQFADESVGERKKSKRTPYRAPERIIILDDMADELKKKSVTALLKKNRHFKCKVIISSQYLNDLPPGALTQLSVICMLRGFSLEKLEEFHSKMRLAIPLEEFVKLYQDATAREYGFLYIDTDHNEYRRGFDEMYE